jgi:hypothetical protein
MKAYQVSVGVGGLTPRFYSMNASSPAVAVNNAARRFDRDMKELKSRGSVAAISLNQALRKGWPVAIHITGVVAIAKDDAA